MQRDKAAIVVDLRTATRPAISHSKIEICSVELQWKGPLDWWLIGSQTYKLQETNRLSNTFCTYIAVELDSTSSTLSHCVLIEAVRRARLSISYAESLGCVESQTQHFLCCWVVILWRGLSGGPDSASSMLSHRTVERLDRRRLFSSINRAYSPAAPPIELIWCSTYCKSCMRYGLLWKIQPQKLVIV